MPSVGGEDETSTNRQSHLYALFMRRRSPECNRYVEVESAFNPSAQSLGFIG